MAKPSSPKSSPTKTRTIGKTVQKSIITINRAPVLTLWAAVVARRIGFDPDEALTLGKAVAGLNAYSKGRSLGIFKPKPRELKAKRTTIKKGETTQIELLHRAVPAALTADGVRALAHDKPIDPASVERYLRSKFGELLEPAWQAMTKLANSLPPDELAQRAYELYEQFRPNIPLGQKGWGASGKLDLSKLQSLR